MTACTAIGAADSRHGISATLCRLGGIRRQWAFRISQPAVAGNPRVEAAMAFDHALARHHRKVRAGRLLGLHTPRALPELACAIPLRRLLKHSPRLEVIAVDRVAGTVGSGDDFDVDFLPTSKRARSRFNSVFAALYSGAYLPPLDVYEWQGRYYVVDGHHRVAAARALGQEFLEANVTEVEDTAAG